MRCYGISRCPTTNEFIVVTSYAEDGDLRQYISKNFDNFSLQKKIITLRDIAGGLVAIHRAGLLHVRASFQDGCRIEVFGVIMLTHSLMSFFLSFVTNLEERLAYWKHSTIR